VPTLTPIIEYMGDYYWVEIKDDNGTTLIRVGFDHKPTQEEIDALIQQLLAPLPPEEVSPLWRP
jgi:hypothetical protein